MLQSLVRGQQGLSATLTGAGKHKMNSNEAKHEEKPLVRHVDAAHSWADSLRDCKRLSES